MGSMNDHGDGMMSGINVTPMVDVTLVLLVIFLVTARLISSPSVPVDLPRASTGGEQQVVLAVTLEASGGTRLDGRPAADDEIRAAARAARERDPEMRAVLQADGAVTHERVVHVMDLLRQEGIARLAFGVQPASGGKP